MVRVVVNRDDVGGVGGPQEFGKVKLKQEHFLLDGIGRGDPVLKFKVDYVRVYRLGLVLDREPECGAGQVLEVGLGNTFAALGVMGRALELSERQLLKEVHLVGLGAVLEEETRASLCAVREIRYLPAGRDELSSLLQ